MTFIRTYRQNKLGKLAIMPALNVSSVEEFQEALDDFFAGNSEKSRFDMKYRHCDSKLRLKVTDDEKVAIFKTSNIQDVKKVEKLSSHAIRAMASK